MIFKNQSQIYTYNQTHLNTDRSIFDVKLVNLSEGNIIEETMSIGGKKIIISYSDLFRTSDFIINVPKLKYHRLPGVTCCLKNYFGAIAKPRKFSYHKTGDLWRAIVAINKAITADLNVVDGLIAYN